jgi:tetratricopeptide (TPR) repeat protein
MNSSTRKRLFRLLAITLWLALAWLAVVPIAPASSAIAARQSTSSSERIARAAELIRQGQMPRAEAELNRALTDSPRNANALNLLGIIRAEQQQTAEAEKLFLRALEYAPALVGAYLNLGKLYLNSRRPDRALWAFTEASKLAPDREEINYNLAALYEEMRDYRRALQYLEKIPRGDYMASHLYILVKCYLGIGRTSEAQSLAAPLKKAGAVPADVAASFAVAFAAHNLTDTAIEILEAALKREPNSYALLYNLGASYYQKGELDRAEQYYSAALGASPDDVSALRALARVARSRGDLKRAYTELDRARRVAPNSAQVLFDFGWTALTLNLLAEALPVLERLYREKPDEPAYLYALAVARVMNFEPDRAQALITSYIRLRPQDARGPYVLGVALFTLNQFREARAALERSLALQPFADTQHYLGLIAYNEGDVAKAIEWFERALKSEPEHAEAHTSLGVAYARQKNLEAARAELERAIELDPKSLKAHHQLSLVYARLGDKRRSQLMLEAAEKLRSEERRQLLDLRLVEPQR